MSSATDHLPRLLALVPWLLAHPDSPIDAVAAEFGVSPDQLRADLDLIWMCGLPGHGPGDLIDVTVTADRVTLSNAETIAAPLRLTPAETLAVVAALRALASLPGIVERGPVERALAKLEASAGSVTSAVDRVAVADADNPDGAASEALAEVAATVRSALTTGRRLRISYWVPARDEVTQRDVDPIRVRSAAPATYLIGWCRLVGDVRTFRLDRVLTAELLDIAAEVPPEAADAKLDESLFTPSPTDRAVRFSLRRSARWVIDYYPVESVEDGPDGSCVVTLRARDAQWVVRLALSLSGDGALLDPPEFRDLVRDAARSALSSYDG